MAGELLSTEQVLLLNNLMYCPNSKSLKSVTGYEGKSIREYINDIDISAIVDDDEYKGFMTGKDWKNIIQAVKNDDTLMNMEIVTTHIDDAEGSGGGLSALFANQDTGEAVVTFKGTAGGEWKDNFVGGGATNTPDGVSTQQQINALEWYQSQDLSEFSTVTVTGHSKGGNKAKYITLMDDSVDRCLSFDGQGFSDEFIEQYSGLIAQRQGKISNNNAEYDYVNLLLNDVGETTFYQGYDFGDGSFLENHCANTMLRFEEDSSVSMVPVDGRPKEMEALDEFLNSYLRSGSPAQKQQALLAVGTIIEIFTASEKKSDMITDILKALANGSYKDELSRLLKYFVKYEQENPEFANAFRRILIEYDMPEFLEVVDMIDGIMNWKYFDTLMNIMSFSTNAPGWITNQLAKFLEDKFGFTLMGGNTDGVKVIPDGKDITVSSSRFSEFSIKPDIIREIPGNMKSISVQMSFCQAELNAISRQLSGSKGMETEKIHISKLVKKMESESKSLEKMGREMERIIKEYTDTESRIINYASST